MDSLCACVNRGAKKPFGVPDIYRNSSMADPSGGKLDSPIPTPCPND